MSLNMYTLGLNIKLVTIPKMSVFAIGNKTHKSPFLLIGHLKTDFAGMKDSGRFRISKAIKGGCQKLNIIADDCTS